MATREGSLEAPKRQAIPWQSPDFTDPEAVDKELERVFDVCHTCRRCVNLCNAFPTLFDLIDESDTFEVDGVAKEDYQKVVNDCYLCDICAETKCPYLPPHAFAVDFPHLMLRAKARYLEESPPAWHTRLLTSTEPLFNIASKPGIAPLTNGALASKPLRKLAQSVAQVHENAPVPTFHAKTAKKRLANQHPALRSHTQPQNLATETTHEEHAESISLTPAKVAIYLTCYGDTFDPLSVEALVKVLNHNGIDVKIIKDAHCCGMPKFELGDIKAVVARNQQNQPVFIEAVKEGYDLMSVVPSCTLMYRQEMPLLLPDEPDVQTVAKHFYDPFEYLWKRHQEGLLNLDFHTPLGKVSYHAACHQRVQNIGRKTADLLRLIPETDVDIIERCSGHGGTHAIRKATYESAMKIARPATRALRDAKPDTFGSDCPIAGRLIVHGLEGNQAVEHPIQMLARAYALN